MWVRLEDHKVRFIEIITTVTLSRNVYCIPANWIGTDAPVPCAVDVSIQLTCMSSSI